MEATLSDSGRAVQVPFQAVMPDPQELAESGRGVALIEALVDEFTYERDVGGTGGVW